MPRRSIFSSAEQDSLLTMPDNQDDLIRYYTFNEQDMSIIFQHRGTANRLGFAIQLCYMRYPGVILSADEVPFPPLLYFVASQLKITVDAWGDYGQRDQTRREHLRELHSRYLASSPLPWNTIGLPYIAWMNWRSKPTKV
jgi:TnpA family transposase